MKKLKLLALTIILIAAGTVQAQVSVSVNIGPAPIVRPNWFPAGYATVDYYYLPDIQTYFDVQAAFYVYYDNGRWIRSRQLPQCYRNYDLYHGRKIVLNGYRGHRPYAYYDNHRDHYYKIDKKRVVKRTNQDQHRYADNYYDRRKSNYSNQGYRSRR